MAAHGAQAKGPDRAGARITVHASPHLKWPAFDILERGLMVLCALLLLAFTLSELGDVLFRDIGHPWLDAEEFSAGFFVWGVFLGAGVAVRRDQHFRLTAVGEYLTGRKRLVVEIVNRLVTLAVALCMIVFGYRNYLTGFGSFLMPSLTPIAYLYAAIPVSGVFVALFTIEELVNGCRRGFEVPGEPGAAPPPVAVA